MPSPLRVLVVEDDDNQRRLLRAFIEKRGHTVAAEFARGDDDGIVSTAADVAVVDLGLPGRSGSEVTRALRDRGVPVLVVSASAHSAAVTEAILAGALGYVVKGARMLEVVDALELVALRRHALPRGG